MALNPNSSKDAELKIKGIPNIAVRNYQQQDNLNQREDAEEVLALAVAAAVKKEDDVLQEEKDILNALAEGDKDDEDIDPRIGPTFVTDLLPLRPQRAKRLPAQNRYFLSQEAEEGSPLCLEDPTNATTDTEDQDDGWDEDEGDEFDPDKEVEDYAMVQQDHHMS
jgi:hypothetical protein